MPEPTTERATAKPARSIYARLEAERRTRADAHEAEQRRRIVEAAGVDPNLLSDQAQRTLSWLAGWGDPTTAGIVELLHATRTAAEIAERKEATLGRSVAATDAAKARHDEHGSLAR
jgi:hypothetical protein